LPQLPRRQAEAAWRVAGGASQGLVAGAARPLKFRL
jgi:hypothetical protein